MRTTNFRFLAAAVLAAMLIVPATTLSQSASDPVTAWGVPLTFQVWQTEQQSDTALNDSDKVFAVPTGKEWRVLYIRYELTTTAVAGNRQPTVQFRDNTGDVLFEFTAAVVAASSSQIIQLSPDLADVIPDVVLKAAWDVRVFDSAAIDQTADDLVVHIILSKRDEP